MVNDVLDNNENLTIEIYTNCFKKIKNLINSNSLSKLSGSRKQIANRQRNSNSKYKSEQTNNINELNINVESNSVSGDDDDDDDENKFNHYLNEPKHFKSKSRRSLPVQCPRRLSGFACSTTTSATGLPIDLPPARQRSLSLKCCPNNCEFTKLKWHLLIKLLFFI